MQHGGIRLHRLAHETKEEVKTVQIPRFSAVCESRGGRHGLFRSSGAVLM